MRSFGEEPAGPALFCAFDWLKALSLAIVTETRFGFGGTLPGVLMWLLMRPNDSRSTSAAFGATSPLLDRVCCRCFTDYVPADARLAGLMGLTPLICCSGWSG